MQRDTREIATETINAREIVIDRLRRERAAARAELERVKRQIAVYEGRTAAVVHDPEWERAEALAAELERVNQARQRESDEADVAVRALNATLERVKAERDNLRRVHIEDTGRWIDASQRLDKALSALREIAEVHETGGDGAHVCAYGRIARRALLDIEGQEVVYNERGIPQRWMTPPAAEIEGEA